LNTFPLTVLQINLSILSIVQSALHFPVVFEHKLNMLSHDFEDAIACMFLRKTPDSDLCTFMQGSSPFHYSYPNVVTECNTSVLHNEHGICGASNPLPSSVNHLLLLLCRWFGPDTKYSVL
jgi:hypothetical protein